ncbi:MAG: DUF368 domain-containing protein [Bacilli bacterium]|nr:DUF368 domain-containing protein [Bacilli bacterium]
MANFFKGILGGIGNIVPGLSGGALFVIMGIYHKCITAITELVKLKNLKKNILFLMPIGLGVVVGTVLFGNIILFFLDIYPMQTTYAFVGFIIGTIPLLFKEANKHGFKKSYIIPLAITFFIGIALLFLKNYEGIQAGSLTFFESAVLGLVLAGSTVIPGISSTVILSLIGYYDYFLYAISKVDLVVLFPIFTGLGVGAIFLVFLVNFLLKKHYGYTYYAVSGFCIATIPAVIRGQFAFNLETLTSLIFAFIAFFITYRIGYNIAIKKEN